MRKKILISIFIIVLILQTIIPIKANAFVENKEITSMSAQIEKHKSEFEVNEETDIDVMSGIMLEPTVELITVVVDSVMAVLTDFMTPNEFQSVMLSYDELPEMDFQDGQSTTFTITEDDMENYRGVGGVVEVKYPYFTYSPEEIFSGKIDLLNIDFISGRNSEGGEITDNGWKAIRYTVSEWYKIIRMVTIIGLLSVLIYTGIKIILSSNAKDKAKYKEMILNWFVAVALAFSMHYIMAFIINVVKEFIGLLGGITGRINVVCTGDNSFSTNLIGLARFQMQQLKFSDKVGHLVIYVALVAYTFKFTFVYLKRVLNMAFLTIISPIVALTYPIDKMDGKAHGFEMWLKEYIYNIILQLMHYILYYILVSTSLTLAATNPLYGIVALMFISQAEKLLKKIFGFDKARAGTVGGIAGAYATGVITSKLFGIGKGKKSSEGSGRQSGRGGDYDNAELPDDIRNDTNIYDFLNENIRGDDDNQGYLQEGETTNNRQIPLQQTVNAITPEILVGIGINDFISRYREQLSDYSDEELGGLTFTEGDSVGNIDDMLQILSQYQRKLKKSGKISAQTEEINEQLSQIRDNSLLSNEINFKDNGIPLQYADGDSRSTSELIDEIMRLNKLADNKTLPASQRRKHAKESERLLRLVKRRMTENQHIDRLGGPQALLQQARKESAVGTEQINTQTNHKISEQSTEQQEKKPRKISRVGKGMKNVGKTIIKPVIDVEKSAGYNGKRLVGYAGKGLATVAGVGLGIGAAAVQAGISITDGKYKPLEGIATIGAGVRVGIAGASSLSQGARQGIRNAKNTYMNNEESMKKYSEQWYNRDDVIDNYNREFPGQGKEMRRRAVENYVSRGITDMAEQKKAIKYAELLRKERGMSIEEADRLAVATLQYKRTLARYNNSNILFDQKEKTKYLDSISERHTGSASRDAVRRLHDDFIENVRDFNRANK